MKKLFFTGIGALENNVLAKRILRDEYYYKTNFTELDETEFENLVNKKRKLD